MRAAYAKGASYAFQKFAVDVETAKHIVDLAGLGLLSVPVLNHVFGDPEHDSPMKKRIMAGTELAGLGALAGPTIHHLMHA